MIPMLIAALVAVVGTRAAETPIDGRTVIDRGTLTPALNWLKVSGSVTATTIDRYRLSIPAGSYVFTLCPAQGSATYDSKLYLYTGATPFHKSHNGMLLPVHAAIIGAWIDAGAPCD